VASTICARASNLRSRSTTASAAKTRRRRSSASSARYSPIRSSRNTASGSRANRRWQKMASLSSCTVTRYGVEQPPPVVLPAFSTPRQRGRSNELRLASKSARCWRPAAVRHRLDPDFYKRVSCSPCAKEAHSDGSAVSPRVKVAQFRFPFIERISRKSLQLGGYIVQRSSPYINVGAPG